MKMLIGQIKLETKLFLRDRRALFLTFAFPAIMILIFGAVFNSQTVMGLPAINFILPGIIVMATMMVAMNNHALKITGDREKGIYRRLSLTPLQRQTLLMGQLCVRYLIVILTSALLIAVATLAFKAKLGGNYSLFLLVLTLGALVFMTLGFTLSSLVKNSQSAMSLCMVVFFPLMFLGGCFWTLDQMPAFLRVISDVLPTTHLNNALRMITLQNAGFDQIWREFPVILLWLAGGAVLAVKFFKWE